MIKLLLIPTLALAFHLQIRAQSDSIIELIPSTTGEIPDRNPENVCILQVQPEYQFPGGQDSLISYLLSKLPDLHVLKSRFVIEFTISADGSVSEPHVLRPNDLTRKQMEEIEHIILTMPKWIPPAEANSESVRYSIAIRLS